MKLNEMIRFEQKNSSFVRVSHSMLSGLGLSRALVCPFYSDSDFTFLFLHPVRFDLKSDSNKTKKTPIVDPTKLCLRRTIFSLLSLAVYKLYRLL